MRDRSAEVYRSVGWSRTSALLQGDHNTQRSALDLGLWLLGSPYDAAGGWRKARRVTRRDAGQFFARAGCPVEKPRHPTAHLEGRRPGRRVIRGALLFGYFLLGKQEKVTRPLAGGRKPAAGEPDRNDATTERTVTGSRPAPG